MRVARVVWVVRVARVVQVVRVVQLARVVRLVRVHGAGGDAVGSVELAVRPC